jgi:hypothetical protein
MTRWCIICAARRYSASAISLARGASFEKALALSPTYYPAAANLANLDIVEKKPADARQRFETLLANDPKSMQALLALAQLRAKDGGTTEEVGRPDQPGGDRQPERADSAAGVDRPVSWQERHQKRAFRGPGSGRSHAERGRDSGRCRACPAGSRRV